MLGTIAGGAVVYLAWLTSLKAISFGLKGLGIDIIGAVASMKTMDAQGKATTITLNQMTVAQKAAFAAAAVGAAYGVVEIVKLIAVIYQWRKAVSEAEDAMDRLKTIPRLCSIKTKSI